MDEETRKEYEELQSKSPLSAGISSDAAKTFQNFDLASWMAGKSTASTAAVEASGSEVGGGEAGSRR